MCTVSWLIEQNNYHLFFNRDEQRSRSKALPPQHFKINNVAVLMPTDPDGGGSWVCVNERGFTLCLLNYYQGETPNGVLSSRGQLLKSLSYCSGLHEFTGQLEAQKLHCYAPFTLLAFERSSADKNNTGKNVICYQWDGIQLLTQNVSSPFTSSSVEFEAVSAARMNNYHTSLNTVPEHIRYHSEHQPEKGYQSVCMHRDDAKTVSFSHIEVSSEQANFHYIDGSPCSLSHQTEQEEEHIYHQIEIIIKDSTSDLPA